MKIGLQCRSERGQKAPVKVIQHRREKKNADCNPPQGIPSHQGNSTTRTSPNVPNFASGLASYVSRILRTGLATPHANRASVAPLTVNWFKFLIRTLTGAPPLSF